MAMHKLAIVTLAALLAACAGVGPEYVKPEVDLPAGWRDAPPDGAKVQEADWWKVYDDPVLDRLVAEALKSNANLALAVARVEEARAIVSVTAADQQPQVSASADRRRTQFSQRAPLPVPPGVSTRQSDTRVSLDVSYEIDLWGKLRNATKAARADLLATEAAQETVRVTLTADVAQGYFALRSLDGQLAAQLAAERAQVPVLEQQRAQQENALAVLLGRSPKAIYDSALDAGSDPEEQSAAIV